MDKRESKVLSEEDREWLIQNDILAKCVKHGRYFDQVEEECYECYLERDN